MTQAWLLNLGHSTQVSVGNADLVHLMADAAMHIVPRAPHFCNRVLEWEDELIPVVDLGAWITKTRGFIQLADGHSALIAICPYSTESRRDKWGAIILGGIPERIVVNDNQQCERLPLARWRPISKSCFGLDDEPVPIVDLGLVFERLSALG